MGYRRNRSYVSPDNFTDYIGARDLTANAARAGFNYDAYGDSYEFNVVVLTQPIPMATKDVGPFFGSYEEDATRDADNTSLSNIRFQGRILGGAFKSLHETLPNPCNIRANGDPATAAKIAAMHTTFISTEGFAGKPPSIGDIVKVTMDPGDFRYSTQYAQFKKIQRSTDSSNRAAEQAVGCQNLAGLFEDFDYENDLGDISITFAPSDAPSSSQERYMAGPLGPVMGGLPTRGGVMTSPFGTRIDPVASRSSGQTRTRHHAGLDFGGAQGTLMYPPFDGTVSRITDPNAAGLTEEQKPWVFGRVEVTHASGDKSVFLHCSEILVAQGATVTANTAVAKMGGAIGQPGTGGQDGIPWSTGPHLHFEYVHGGARVNPYTYLRWSEQLNGGRSFTPADFNASRSPNTLSAEEQATQDAQLAVLGMPQ